MPRIKTEEEMTADLSSDSQFMTMSEAPAERVPRVRRAVPEGVTVGLLDAPVPVDAPPVVQRRGRKVDPKSMELIETMKANLGQWYLIGVFQSNANPTKGSVYEAAGVVFSNTRREDGCFDRFARIPEVAAD